MARGVWRVFVVVALALVPVTWTATAQAHGDEETQEGYVLVQQALAHLTHDTSPDGVDLAMEKVEDALATQDQHGVDVAEVEDGMQALRAGRVAEARRLLQHSIAEALADRPLATGYESGTGLLPSALPGRGPLTGGDWLVVALCLALAGLGIWLAVRFRPRESVSALRLLLGTKPTRTEGRGRRSGMGRHQR